MSINYQYKAYCSDYMSLFDLFRKSFYNLVKDTNLTPKEREVFFSSSYLPSKKRYFRKIDLVTSYLDLIKKFPVFRDETILKECILLYNSSKQRRRRLKKRVETIISKPSVFFTLTFKDEDFERTTFEQRRKAVCRYLKSFNALYVANVDFGSENGREHYHGLIQVPKIELSSWRDNFGNINVKKVYSSTDSVSRIAQYINKLTNHSIKNTCNRYSIIYSR